MADFLLSMEMRVQADQAKAELRALQGEVAKGKTEVAGLGATAASADGQLDGLAAATGRAAAANTQLAQTQTQVRATAGAAAGSVGNLVAQFNDIGMMMAAGQNPLQLAIQQGTQITQVIGPMGASGAVKALGGALLNMLNPVNLATYAAIAAGAAFVQWLTSGEGAAKDLTVALEDAGAAIDALKQASKVTTDDLRGDFGAVTADIVELQAALGKLASVKAFSSLRESAESLRYETQGAWLAIFTDDRWDQAGQVADLLGTDIRQQLSDPYGGEVGAFIKSLDDLNAAKGPREQLEVFRSLRQQMEEATGGIDQMTLTQAAFYESLLAGETQLRAAIKARTDETLRAQELARGSEKDDGRMGGPINRPMTQNPADIGIASELLATLKQQADVQALITQYGRDSESVALARLQAERAAFSEMLSGLDVADGLKTELIAAWDAANGLASARMAAAIEAALGPASRLAGLLQSAAGWLSQLRAGYSVSTFKAGGLAAQYASYGQGRVAGEQAIRSEGALYGGDGNIFTKDMIPDRSSAGSGGGGGGGAPDPESFTALTSAAEKAMATLDASIAGINEKVRLGLMSTAEGTKAIASAKDQAANAIAALIPKLERASDAAGPKAAAAVAKWRAEVRGLVVDLGEAGSELSEKLSNSFEKSFAAFLTGAKSGKAAMADFKNFILQQMAEIAAQKFTASVITPLLDSIMGGLSGSAGSPLPFAKGGIPGGPGISAYSGTIVDQPTFFPMAKGAFGLMGEAGPEAVMPLSRGADGKLGVRASGGGGAPVTVNVINNAQGTKATSRERQEGGMSIVDVVIEQVEAQIAGNIAQGRGPMPDALSATFGLSRVGF